MPTWPESLPTPLLEGHKIVPQDNAYRSKFDDGTVFSERRYTGVTITHNPKAILTDEQLETFWTWWRDDLAQGTLPFMITMKTEQGAIMTRRVVLTKMPMLNIQQQHTRVELMVQVLPNASQ